MSPNAAQMTFCRLTDRINLRSSPYYVANVAAAQPSGNDCVLPVTRFKGTGMIVTARHRDVST